MADRRFELLILDMGLREREGLRVLRELRARGTRMPILVLSGRRERDAATLLGSGADDYMRKPLRFDELVARVRARLRKATGDLHLLGAGEVRLDLKTRRGPSTIGPSTSPPASSRSSRPSSATPTRC